MTLGAESSSAGDSAPLRGTDAPVRADALRRLIAD
jgi:hypothetical protein